MRRRVLALACTATVAVLAVLAVHYSGFNCTGSTLTINEWRLRRRMAEPAGSLG